jgi:RNA polymerase sigma-70 factor (ECF subfamily)
MPIDERLEREAASALVRGDLAAAAELVMRGYGPEILGYLHAVLRDPDVAGDVFSQLAEDLWRGLPAFRRESTLRTWAYKLAWHAASRARDEAYQRRRRRLATHDLSSLAEEVRSRTAAHLRTEVKDRFAELRAGLEPEEQTLLILRVDRDLSWREIAGILSGPGAPVEEAAVRKRFERLKDKLAERARAAGLLDR